MIATAALALSACSDDPDPKGEGSYDEAQKIIEAFESDAIREFVQADQRWAHAKGELGNEARFEVVGSDSHAMPKGGTVGVRFDDGSNHVFFIHVCGKGGEALSWTAADKPALLEVSRELGAEYDATSITKNQP